VVVGSSVVVVVTGGAAVVVVVATHPASVHISPVVHASSHAVQFVDVPRLTHPLEQQSRPVSQESPHSRQ
jgi:hypothetical protein